MRTLLRTSNILFILYLFINWWLIAVIWFFIGDRLGVRHTLPIFIVLYLGTMIFSLSAAGEALALFLIRAHPVQYRPWIERLDTIRMVCADRVPGMRSVRFFIVDSEIPSVFSAGRTICLSRSMLDMTESVLTGALVQQCCTVSRGDSVCWVMALPGNILFMGILFLLQLVSLFFHALSWLQAFLSHRFSVRLFSIIFQTAAWTANNIFWICLIPMRLLVTWFLREKALEADRNTVELGFGNELMQAILVMNQGDGGYRNLPQFIWESLLASYPEPVVRMGRIEGYRNTER